MRAVDLVGLALNSLTHRKLRSVLTMLGIVIGVVSVVGLLSISEGFRENIGGQLGRLGGNVITVTPGFNRAQAGGFGPGGDRAESTSVTNLTLRDVTVVRSTSGVHYVDPLVSGRATVTFDRAKASLTVQGVDPNVWRYMETAGLQAGRYLDPGDSTSVVLGSAVASSVFPKPVLLNQPILVGGHTLRVVGILESAGTFGQQDRTIYVTTAEARILLGQPGEDFSSISLTAASGSDPIAVGNDLTGRLLLERGKTGATQDFTVTTGASFQNRIASISSTFTVFLGSIAAIALVVGAIGIANTMFMAVMERAKSIGILKALGATNREIRRLFLLESSLMGFLGGLLGCFLGIVLAQAVGGLGLRTIGPGRGTLHLVVTPHILGYALLFATLIGAVAGVLPALRAARLQPVDTLRSE